MQVWHPGELKRDSVVYNKGRKAKDYQIRLDNEGNAIVSETVWKRLQEVSIQFIVLNEVSDPPMQIAGFFEGEKQSPVVYKEIAGAISEIFPPGVNLSERK